MGVTKVITRWRTGERTAGWGVSLVLYGVLWLLYTERVFSMWQLVPAFLIAWGAGFVLQGVGFGGRRSEGRDDH